MSNEMEHRSKADHDESFLLMIENTDTISQYLDWRYIALYYSALHFGDAYLAKPKKSKKGIIVIKDHRDRDKNYAKNLPKDAYVVYKTLENRSKIARYVPEMSSVLTVSDFNDLYNNEFPKLKSIV